MALAVAASGGGVKLYKKRESAQLVIKVTINYLILTSKRFAFWLSSVNITKTSILMLENEEVRSFKKASYYYISTKIKEKSVQNLTKMGNILSHLRKR